MNFSRSNFHNISLYEIFILSFQIIFKRKRTKKQNLEIKCKITFYILYPSFVFCLLPRYFYCRKGQFASYILSLWFFRPITLRFL